MKRMRWLWMAVVVLGACQGPKGDQGEMGLPGLQGPAPVVAVGGGLAGDATSASPLRVAARGVTSDHLAGPARLYSRLMTPRWLQANADFHSARVTTITDTGVSFGAAGAGNVDARLLTVPLLPANTLQPNETYLVRIVVNQVVASADNDPAFGITDGVNFVGILKADSQNTEIGGSIVGAYGNNLNSPAYGLFTGPGQNAENFELLLRLAPVAGSNTPVFFAGRVGTLAGRNQADSPLDRTRAISFAIFGGHDTELYTFQSFEVTIDREG